MKKRVVMAIVSAMLILTTACGGESNKTELITDTADIFGDNNIGEEADISINRSDDVFTEALSASIKEENITIYMNFNSAYGEETLINDATLKYNYKDTHLASVKMLSNDNGTETNVSGYYEDGYYYSDIDGNKTKEAMEFVDFVSQNDGYSTNVDSGLVSRFGCIENGDSTTYIVEYDPIAYENQLLTDIEAAGDILGDDETFMVSYANVVFNVDENGYMEDYIYTVKANHKVGDEINRYDYKIAVEFYDIGSTRVDVPDDLDTYVEETGGDAAN